MVDVSEYDRWLATANGHLRAAMHAADGAFHSSAVLQAEQAVQCALKGLLHGIGEKQAARGHDLVALAAACDQQAGLALNDAACAGLARLGRDYAPTRYPDALPGGIPMDRYGVEDSAAATALADGLIAAVRAAWSRLIQAAGDHR